MLWWQRLVDADRLSSRAAKGLIEASVAAGDRGRALQFALVHDALVRQELGSPPDPAIAEWVERLRGQGTHPPALPPLPPSPPRNVSPIEQRVLSVLGGRYVLGQRITESTVVTTYAARAVSSGHVVEVHVVQPQIAECASSDRFASVFERVVTLVDPRIVRTPDFGARDGVLCYVAVRQEGVSLRQRLATDRAGARA